MLDGRPPVGGLPASQFITPLAVAVLVLLSLGGIALMLSPHDASLSGLDRDRPEPVRVPLFERQD